MALVPLLAALALAATVLRRDRRWWLVTLPLLLAGTGTILVSAAWYLHDHIIRDHYPKSFGIWVGEALFAAGTAVAGWRGAARWRRFAAAAAVPLAAASAFVLINAQYAYWPTVGDLLGRPLPHEMTAAALADVLARPAEAPGSPGTTAPAPALTALSGGPSPWDGLGTTTSSPTGAAAAGQSALLQPDGSGAGSSAGTEAAPGAEPPPASADPADGAGLAGGRDGTFGGDPGSGSGDSSAGPSATSDPSSSGFAAASSPDPAAGSSSADSAGAPAPGPGSHRHPDRSGHRPRGTAGPQPTMHGALAPLDIPATRSGFKARQGTLYLPPVFFSSPRPALPLIVMVGGTPGGPDDWPRAGFAAQTADLYASAHNGVAPILAFVDHNGGTFTDTECVDGPAGRAETYLAADVPHYLATELRLPTDPRHWAIAGFSEGGTCAFELAARHPDVYGTFLDIAGDWAPNQGSEADTLKNIYGGDRAAMAAHDPANLLTANRLRNSRGWLVVGTSDKNHVAVAERLIAAAHPSGLTTSRTLLAGGHNWALAGAGFRAVLPELMHDLAGSQTT